MKIDIHLSLYGEKFSPALLKLRTGLALTETSEVGDSVSTKRFSNGQLPYGSATLRLHDPTDEYGPQIEALISAMETNIDAIRQSGAEDLVLWIVAYSESDEQCNLELSPIEMGKLSSMGVSVAISVHDMN